MASSTVSSGVQFTDALPEPIEPRRLFIQTTIGILILMGLTFLAGHLLQAELVSIGEGFVRRFGGPGIMVCCGAPDAFPVPPPHEICMAFGRLGGLAFWEVVGWATLGSVSGGFLGYMIGRSLSKASFFQTIVEGRGRLAWQAIRRHGPLALAIGALSPVPYSVCCWASGAVRMHPGLFLLVSLLRMPRLAFYLWLIQLGLVDLHLG